MSDSTMDEDARKLVLLALPTWSKHFRQRFAYPVVTAHRNWPMKTLYRAAKDDYVEQGISFAPKKSTAEAYLDNPGYGGASLYKTSVDLTKQPALDMTGWTWRDVRANLDVKTPSGVGIDEWLPRDPEMLDRIRSLGYFWAKVDESYPRGEVTWIWCGTSDDDEPELEAL